MQHRCEWISKIIFRSCQTWKNWCFIIITFLTWALFWPFIQMWWIKKWQEPKKSLKQKINFFMPVNYEKEFLKSIHTGVVFWELFSWVSLGPHYSRSWNFQLKMSFCSVFQHAELKFQGCSWIWDNGFALAGIIRWFLCWLGWIT